MEAKTKLGDVRIVKGCMICHEEIILIATRNSSKPMVENDTILPQICKKCTKKYLTKGVLLINPDSGALVVLKDEAFKRIFNVPKPKGKIAFVEQEVLEMLNESNKQSEQKE